MQPVTTATSSSATSGITDINIAAFGVIEHRSQRRVSIPSKQELYSSLKKLSIQPRQGALFSSSESGSSTLSSDEEYVKHKTIVPPSEYSGQQPQQENRPIQEVSPELPTPSFNTLISPKTRPWHSDSEIHTLERDGSEYDIKLSSSIKLWSSSHVVSHPSPLEDKPTDTCTITTSKEIPSSTLIPTEQAQLLEDIPDTSFTGKSLQTRSEQPEELTVQLPPEVPQIPPTIPDFPPRSGARPKTTPAEPKKKKKKKKKKHTEKTATSGSAKDTAPPSQPVSAPMQDEPAGNIAPPRKPDIERSIPIKGLTQKMLQLGSNEFQFFHNEIKRLYQQISKQNWNQINRILRNLERFLPELERLISDYELFKRNYPASSTDKRPFGKTENVGVGISIIFTYEQRSEAALMLGRIAQSMLEHMEQFLLRHQQQNEFLDHLLNPILKTACFWFKWIIESRINDQQAICDQHGTGVPFDEAVASINLRHLFSLKAKFNEPKYSETQMNQVFYRVISWLASGNIYYQRHLAARQPVKPEYLVSSQQLLIQLLQQYRDYHTFKKYEPRPDEKNFHETQLNYAEQLIFSVHAQRWDLAQMTLKQLSSMIANLESWFQKAPQADRQEESQETAFKELVNKATRLAEHEDWPQQCANRRFYKLHDYLSMSLNAGHQCFDFFYQQHISPSAPKEYSLHIEQLQTLLTRFKQWAERIISYGLVITSEQTIDPLYLEAQHQLEENSRQLEQLHQNNLRFLAQYFQEQVAPQPRKPKDRKKRETIQVDGADSHREEDSPEVSSEASAAPPIVQADSGVADITAVVEETEHEEEFSDDESDWQQVRPRRRRLPVEAALSSLSEALNGQNTEGAKTALKSTNLDDALQQLQNPSTELQALPVDVLSLLVSGYLQVRDMSHHINTGESLIPDIRPFITSLLDENTLTSIDITNRFTAAIEAFNNADVAAQYKLDDITETIYTLLDNFQTEEEPSSNLVVMTACDVLITSVHKLNKRLVHLREGIINAWKKRYELLLRHYPEKLKAKKGQTKSTDKPLQTLFSNNKGFKKCSSGFEKCQNMHQERQKTLLHAEQSTDSAWEPESKVAIQNIDNILKLFELSREQAPTMTVLSHRIDCIAQQTSNMPEDESAYRLALFNIALELDIEISVIYIDSDTTQDTEREPNRPQPEQRPPLVNYFSHPLFPFPERERIQALRDYFHLTIPAILADLNADETGMPVVLTGSMAFQLQILSLWDNAADSTLSLLYEQAAQHLPTGITHNHMQACMTPRDTDLIILIRNQFTEIVERLKSSLNRARLEHWNLQHKDGDVDTSGLKEMTDHNNKKLTTDRIFVTSTDPFPENIPYVVDVAMGLYPDQPSPDHYTTLPYGNSNIHLRRMDDIILDELDIIKIKSVGEERIQKAITRLFMIAFLECQQPKLDSISRIALLYALDSLPGEDPIITTLAEQLRQRPFYIICHKGHFQGARQAVPDRSAPPSRPQSGAKPNL